MSQDQLDRIEKKLDENTLQTLENTLNLREHMRRTDLLEQIVENTSDRIRPIENHVQMMAGAFKLILILSTIVGLVAGVLALVQYAK